MSAIVTDPLKKYYQTLVFNEISSSTDSNEFFIGIGKSDDYNATDTVVNPVRTLEEERELRNNLSSIKKITAQSFVVPRYNWSSGAIYSSWSDNQTGYPTNSYYVLTEDNEVYICLKQGKSATGAANTSIVKPSYSDAGVSETSSFETSDGYVWKLCYAISAGKAADFLSATYMPVQDITIDSSSANTFELQQLNVQNGSTPGQIIGVEIVDGGTGYTSAPAITFKGNGSGASATATISGGTIVKVEMDDDSASLGSGYDFASATISGTGSLRPIIGPRDGIGKSSINDLKSSSLMFNIRPDGTEGNTFNVDNDFRQISFFKNLELTDSAAAGPLFKGTSANTNRYLTLTGTITASGFAVDEVITGGTSGVTAYIDELDSANGNKIWFHQNSNNVAGVFTDGESLSGSASGSGTVDSGDKYSTIDIYSGDLLYIENRSRVIRSASQQEDIKIVITV